MKNLQFGCKFEESKHIFLKKKKKKCDKKLVLHWSELLVLKIDKL
jgi:hypothetical protein